MTQPLSPIEVEHAALQKLRDLLAVPETARVDNIEELLNTPELQAQEVAKVLAEAVRIRNHSNDDLGLALGPSIESAITTSVSKNPKPLSDALFPVMGPAIRAAINNAIASMLQSLNKTLEHSFSPKGLRWRLDAFRTGKSFAEVVLLNTLLYRVEQAFLIHKETGLLLHHLSHDPSQTEDADLVSSMLTAVRDFIRDSFAGNTDQEVDNLRMGDLEIIVKQGPEAILAIVCRGSSPQDLQLKVQTCIEDIHLTFSEDLHTFNGDNKPFEAADEFLSPLLIADYSKGNTKKSSPIKAILTVAIPLIALFAWAGWNQYEDSQQQQQEAQLQAQWQRYFDQLNNEPGLIISQVKQKNGIYTLSGLRDPLASKPNTILKKFALPANHLVLQLQPYHALHQPFILQRATKLLAAPKEVSLSLRDHILTISGIAKPDWVKQSKQSVLFIAGIDAVDTSHLAIYNLHSALLKKAKQALNPPTSVTLILTDNTLHVSGSTSQAWAKQAALSIQSISAIKTYDDRKLILTDSPAQLLKMAYRALKPPKGVRLYITKSKRLIAKGSASKAWTSKARKLAKKIKGIKSYSDRNVKDPLNNGTILTAANQILQPPASTLLFFEKGTLYAGGKATSAWINRLKQKATSITGVKRYNIAQLLNTTEMWQTLTGRARNIQLTFVGGSMNFPANEHHKLDQLIDLFHQSQQLRPSSQLQITGLSNNGQSLALAFARARYIRSVLEQRGMISEYIQISTRGKKATELSHILFSFISHEDSIQ